MLLRCYKSRQVVAINGPHVVESKFIESVPGTTMPFMCSSVRLARPWHRQTLQHPFTAFERSNKTGCSRFAQSNETVPHIFRNRHRVVVENHKQVRVRCACVIERFKSRPAVIAPSPITLPCGTVSFACLAMAIPSAALMDVEEWPTPNVS